MNPCPCGRYGDLKYECPCSPAQVAQYLGRLSAPLLERFDIHLEVPRVDLRDFDDFKLAGDTSVVVAERVKRARDIQIARQGKCNARLQDAQVNRLCALDKEGRKILNDSVDRWGLSARARQRILKLARTIADLAGDENLTAGHVGEAVQFRKFDRRA